MKYLKYKVKITYSYTCIVYRFQNLGEMMVLGRNDAAITPSFIEGITLEGPIGHTGN